MNRQDIREGRQYAFDTGRGTRGQGKVIEVYLRHTWWVIVQDRKTKKTYTLRPSMIYPKGYWEPVQA